MKKRNLFIISLILLSLLITACSSKDENVEENESSVAIEGENTEKNNDGAEITFMIPDWGAPTDEMINEFKDETGITLTVLPTSWDDIRSKIATAAAGNQVAADVFEVDWSWLGEFRAADWLMPISLEEADIEDMPTLKSFTVDGEIYAIPYANDFRIAYYNEELFSEVGKTAPKTWDDLFETAQLLKENGIVEYPVGLPLRADESTTTTLMWLSYTRNNVLFNEDNTINEEAVRDGLEVIDKFMKAGLIDPSNTEISGQQVYAKILNGEIAFMIGPSSYVTRVNDESQSEVVGKIKPVVLPGKTDTASATLPFAEAIGISKYTENKEAAETFVKWYTSKKNQEKMFSELSTLPTRSSVLSELVENDEIKESGAMVELSKMIESPFPNGVPDYYTRMSTEIFNTVNQMVIENISLDQAVEDIVTKVNTIVEENK